ncbi:MAG: hypothetical protein WCC74_01530 [Minisyncoccia bacterium]
MPPEENTNQNILANDVKSIDEETSKFLNLNSNSLSPRGKTIIRTYKSDVEETVLSNHLSSVNIALSENRKMMERLAESKDAGQKDKKNYIIILVSFFLVILGVLAVVIPVFLVNKKYTPVVIPIRISPIINPDSTEDLNLEDLDQTRIPKTLAERVEQTSIKVGSIRGIYLTEKNVDNTRKLTDINKFITLLKFNVPDILARTLRPDYLFGMHNFIGNQSFLILKFGSYDNAYSGMLSWEKDLWINFKDLFGIVDSDDSFSTDVDVFAKNIKNFQDIVIKNKDCRGVEDSAGKILLLYCILDKETVIITTSQDTLKEILLRMTSKQTVSQ